MINFWITFWSIISELTKAVLLKGKYLKNIFFLKQRSFPFHTLKRRPTDVKFCVGLLKPKENMFELVRQPCFKFEKLLCFPLYIPRTKMRCWFEFEREMVYFWMMFHSIIWKKKTFEKQFEERYLISNDTQFHSTFLTEEPHMSNFVLQYLAFSISQLRRLHTGKEEWCQSSVLLTNK